MYTHDGWGFGPGSGMWFINAPFAAAFGGLFLLVAVWSIAWKGLGLWHSGRNDQPWWFAIILVTNTLGILEIIYLFGILKLRFDQLFTKGSHHPHKHHHEG